MKQLNFLDQTPLADNAKTNNTPAGNAVTDSTSADSTIANSLRKDDEIKNGAATGKSNSHEALAEKTHQAEEDLHIHYDYDYSQDHPIPSQPKPKNIKHNNDLKITSWNVNSVTARLDHVHAYLDDEQPDILMLQEIKTVNEKFPTSLLDRDDYDVFIHGQKAYNGVAVFAKKILRATMIRNAFPCFLDDPQARLLEIFLPDYDLYLLNIYLPNGNPYPSEKYDYKLKWMQSLDRWISGYDKMEKSFIIGGDFNIIPENIDVYNPKSFHNDAAFHDDVRAMYRTWLNHGMVDAWRSLHPGRIDYSFWDYQKGRWMKNEGLRIDHFLLSPYIAHRLQDCRINQTPRSKEKPSDHAPVECLLTYQNAVDTDTDKAMNTAMDADNSMNKG
jgi:exodeoxyribonuclease-3